MFNKRFGGLLALCAATGATRPPLSFSAALDGPSPYAPSAEGPAASLLQHELAHHSRVIMGNQVKNNVPATPAHAAMGDEV